MCAGSKNVHILIRNREDIAKYSGIKFSLAREICYTILDNLDRMDVSRKHRILNLLCHTQWTAVFELLSPHVLHIEDHSGMKDKRLQFITWTSCDLEPSTSTHLGVVPAHRH